MPVFGLAWWEVPLLMSFSCAFRSRCTDMIPYDSRLFFWEGPFPPSLSFSGVFFSQVLFF